MSTQPEQVNRLIESVNNIKDYFEGHRASLESRQALSEQKHQTWLDTRHVGFALTDTLIDHSDSPITLQPRFSTLAEAEAFEFNSSDDYSPAGSYTDLQSAVPATTNWYSEPFCTQFTETASVYASIGVGNSPHPTPKPVSRIALLHNQIGSHHQLMTCGATPEYNKPRVFMGKDRNKNLEIKGQHYGSNYDDRMMFAENESHNMSIGFSYVRVINLGPYPIHVKGFWILYHGHQKEA